MPVRDVEEVWGVRLGGLRQLKQALITSPQVTPFPPYQLQQGEL